MSQIWTPHRALSLGCEVRLLADNTLKTSGTIYGVIYDRRRDVYWTGAAWSASLSAVSLTHEAGGNWRYSLAASAWQGGAEIVMLYATDDSGGAASATVYSCKEESAFATALNLAMIGDLIELQRGRHTRQGPQMFYVDPHNGTTIAGGADGSWEKPLSTVTEALSLVTTRHAVIELLAQHSTSATLTEAVTITKPYTLIRGPGRDFLWTRSGAGDTITIDAEGVELAGFRVGTAATGTGAGIKIGSGASADFARLYRLWILNTQGHGIHLLNSSRAMIEECNLEGPGVGATGHGIALMPTSGSIYGAKIRDCVFADVQGDAVRVGGGGGTVDHTEVCHNKIHGSTGWAVNLLGGTDAMICYNVWGSNTSGNLSDGGTRTLTQGNSDAPTAAVIADAVWDEAIAGHVAAGSTGKALDDVPTTGEINTALEAAHGSGSWENIPAGTYAITVTLTDAATSAPIVGARVIIYDSAETNPLRGGTTDGTGSIVCYLDAGTYAVRCSANGYTFTSPAASPVVSANATISVQGTALATAPTPAAPSQCAVYGTITDASGTAIEGADVGAYGLTVQTIGGAQIGSALATTTTAAVGTFTLNLAQGAVVRFVCEAAGIDQVLTVPVAASVDLVDWVTQD